MEINDPTCDIDELIQTVDYYYYYYYCTVMILSWYKYTFKSNYYSKRQFKTMYFVNDLKGKLDVHASASSINILYSA